jgi:hypothetical protein
MLRLRGIFIATAPAAVIAGMNRQTLCTKASTPSAITPTARCRRSRQWRSCASGYGCISRSVARRELTRRPPTRPRPASAAPCWNPLVALFHAGVLAGRRGHSFATLDQRPALVGVSLAPLFSASSASPQPQRRSLPANVFPVSTYCGDSGSRAIAEVMKSALPVRRKAVSRRKFSSTLALLFIGLPSPCRPARQSFIATH